MAGADGIGSDLDRWLEPFLEVLGHKRRRSWAPLYLRGLLGPSERKSLQPMAASLGLSGHDQLQHFIASPAWDDAPLWRVLAEQADQLVGGPEAALVIDDTALPKKGTLSGGVGDPRGGPAEEGHALGGRGAAVLRPAGQAGELPGAGLADPGWPGGARPCRAAAVPARGVDPRSGALRGRRRAGRRGGGPSQGRDRASRVGPAHRGRGAVRRRAGRCRLWGECRLPPRAERAWPDLGGWHLAQPEGL